MADAPQKSFARHVRSARTEHRSHSVPSAFSSSAWGQGALADGHALSLSRLSEAITWAGSRQLLSALQAATEAVTCGSSASDGLRVTDDGVAARGSRPEGAAHLLEFNTAPGSGWIRELEGVQQASWDPPTLHESQQVASDTASGARTRSHRVISADQLPCSTKVCPRPDRILKPTDEMLLVLALTQPCLDCACTQQ